MTAPKAPSVPWTLQKLIDQAPEGFMDTPRPDLEGQTPWRVVTGMRGCTARYWHVWDLLEAVQGG